MVTLLFSLSELHSRVESGRKSLDAAKSFRHGLKVLMIKWKVKEVP